MSSKRASIFQIRCDALGDMLKAAAIKSRRPDDKNFIATNMFIGLNCR